MRAIDEDKEACLNELLDSGADLKYKTKVGARVECAKRDSPVYFVIGVRLMLYSCYRAANI